VRSADRRPPPRCRRIINPNRQPWIAGDERIKATGQAAARCSGLLRTRKLRLPPRSQERPHGLRRACGVEWSPTAVLSSCRVSLPNVSVRIAARAEVSFRQGPQTTHYQSGPVTAADTSQQRLSGAAIRNSAPAIRANGPAVLQDPLEAITAFYDSALIRQVDKHRGIVITALGPLDRWKGVTQQFGRSWGER
jgi:hypothetical protein